MNDFKDKIYARELLAKTCEKLLNEPNPGYMKIAGYLKKHQSKFSKKRAIKSRRK